MKNNKVITEPRVYLIGRQQLDEGMLKAFLDDEGLVFETDTEIPAEVLAEAAGRTCYMSFGKGRKTNADYLERIISSHHGSVLEHVVWNFIITGVSRSLTHELIRHRAGFGYCLTGDTLIYSERYEGKTEAGKPKRNGPKKRRLYDIYKMTLTPHGRSRLKLLRLRCLDDKTGEFTRGKVKSVACSGKRPVFCVKLEDGKKITCSKDHRFLTANGWMSLDEITGGLDISHKGLAVCGNYETPIMVNGVEAYKDRSWLEKHYHKRCLSHEDMAKLVGVSKHTIRSWIRKHQLQKPPGSWTVGVEPWNKGRRYRAGWRHSAKTKEFLARMKRGERNPQWKGGITRRASSIRKPLNRIKQEIFRRDKFVCRVCGEKSHFLTIHHIIPIWAAPNLAHVHDNLATVCASCHHKLNGKEIENAVMFGRNVSEVNIKAKKRGIGRLLIPRPRRIIDITYEGQQMTYDIEMEDPHSNFVANGIVTHNSQLSQRYVDESEAHYVVPPFYRGNPELYERWLAAVENAHRSYVDLVEATEPFVAEMHPELTKTDRRKIVRQSARSVLPNACETKIFVSANGRALRHFFEMRGSLHADAEIRDLAVAMCRLMKEEAPNIFADVEIVLEDGIDSIAVKHSKV